MSKTKSKSRSELEYLRGQVRQLKAELKYYKRRDHFYEAPVEEIVDEVHNVNADQCPSCGRGILIHYDFVHATLSKCGECGYEKRQKIKGHETKRRNQP